MRQVRNEWCPHRAGGSYARAGGVLNSGGHDDHWWPRNYGDIESGDYAQAWALLDSGLTTGQTYQQFVNGFACTGAQGLSKNWESGDEVNFDLAATNDCTGAVQDFTGIDTVVDGKIVAANVSQTG
jgi:hypothetical protein